MMFHHIKLANNALMPLILNSFIEAYRAFMKIKMDICDTRTIFNIYVGYFSKNLNETAKKSFKLAFSHVRTTSEERMNA